MVETVIQRIKALLKEKGLKQKYLFEQIGKSPVMFRDWQAGKSKPTDSVLQKISDVLDTTPEYLRGETDIKAKEKSPSISDEDIKFALFGGDGDVSDEAWEEVKRFAAYAKEKYGKK